MVVAAVPWCCSPSKPSICCKFPYTVTVGKGGSGGSSTTGNDGNWQVGEPGNLLP